MPHWLETKAQALNAELGVSSTILCSPPKEANGKERHENNLQAFEGLLQGSSSAALKGRLGSLDSGN